MGIKLKSSVLMCNLEMEIPDGRPPSNISTNEGRNLFDCLHSQTNSHNFLHINDSAGTILAAICPHGVEKCMDDPVSDIKDSLYGRLTCPLAEGGGSLLLGRETWKLPLPSVKSRITNWPPESSPGGHKLHRIYSQPAN